MRRSLYADYEGVKLMNKVVAILIGILYTAILTGAVISSIRFVVKFNKRSLVIWFWWMITLCVITVILVSNNQILKDYVNRYQRR